MPFKGSSGATGADAGIYNWWEFAAEGNPSLDTYNFTGADRPLRTATKVVAASDSSQSSIDMSDYQCDGTDDDVQIQQAIDALPSDGGKVLLMEGTFTIGATIDLANKIGVTIEGVALGEQKIGLSTFHGSRITLAAASNCTMIEKDESAGSAERAAVIIRNLCLNGNKSNQTGGTCYGIHFNNFKDLRIENVIIYACRDSGFRIRDCEDTYLFCCLSITNSTTAGAGFDVTSAYLAAINCESGGNYRGYEAATTRYQRYINCIAYNSIREGFYLTPSMSMTSLISCLSDDNELDGMSLGGADFRVMGCHIWDNGQTAGASRAGIALSATNSSIIGNTIRDTQGTATQKYGVLESGSGDNNIILGNDFRGNATGQVKTVGEATIVQGNQGVVGIGETRTSIKTVNYDDSSPVSVFSAEDGFAVSEVWVEVTTTWDGTGATLDIGDGNDTNGFLATAQIDLTTAGYYGDEADDGGAYLWDAGNTHRRHKVYTGSDTVDATITPGSGASQGVAIVYVKTTRIGG